ncbi:MAG: DUF4339 domain-containing protein [Phycisphaerae bacterium]|jgi:hypothetical protein|nr:DUF4339 domain-containing protein [Phycisphaerae bacterium]
MHALSLVIHIGLGIGAAAIASHKGRSVVGWFFGGFFLGVIGIIIVAVLPNKTLEQQRLHHAERERRRLREQLRQERIKSEAFRRYTSERLDSHDDVLGIDTRTRDALPDGTVAEPHQLASDGPPPVSNRNRIGPARLGPNPHAPIWFYERHGQATGPVSAQDIRQLLCGGSITDATLIWSQDLGEWTPAADVDAFKET